MKSKLLIYTLPVLLVMFLIYGFSTQDNPDKDAATNEIATNTIEKYNSTIGTVHTDASGIALYSQEELISNPGAGFGGANASAITSPGTTFGYTDAISTEFRMADDFTIPAGETWNIDSIIIFHYQTNSTTTSTINDVNLQIWDGATPGTGNIVAGDSTGNRLLATHFSNIYRVTTTTLTNNQRPIMRSQVDMSGTSLGPGTYWIDYAAGGTLASGPFNPPRTIAGQPITGNAFQRNGVSFVWAPALDATNPQGAPFAIYGSIAGCQFPEIPTITITDLNPNPITCGSILRIPPHNGQFTVTATGEQGEMITLSEIHNLIPTDCKSIVIDPPLPITQISPIVVNVTVTRNNNQICTGDMVFNVSDECIPPNTSSCRILFDNPLPVELSSFVSTVSGNNVNLDWSTSTETNNSRFEIERSATEGQWSKVSEVAGNGTTSNPNYYSFTDRGLNSGTYNYRLKQIDFNGNFEYFNLSNEVNVGTPDNYRLGQNYPNPFNPSTTIEYALPKDGFAVITVFDNSGKEVSKLVSEFKTSGYHTVSFNGSSVASGIYFYKLEVRGVDNFVQVRKMVLVK